MTAQTPQAASKPKQPGGQFRRLRRDWPLLVMVLPTLIWLAMLHYFPMLGNVMAFQEYNPFLGTGITAFLNSEWVGLYQFERLFASADFWRSMGNTLFFTVLGLVFFFPIPIALALVLNSINSYWVKAITQSILYLPHFLSWVIVVTISVHVLGSTGLLTQAGSAIGFSPPQIIGNPSAFPALVIGQAIWKDAGWGVIIFLAALAAVSSELHESAAIDGAGKWRRMWHVTLPGIRPVIILLLIMRLGDALSVGFEQFLLQRDAVGPDRAEVLDTYVYFTGVVASDYSYGAAAGLFKAIVGLVLILGANKVAHMLGESGVYQKA